MPASKTAVKSDARSFTAVLERTNDRLHWVIARVPFDVSKVWGRRGQLRVQGEINGFQLSTTLFPTGKGEHFLIVNKKLQAGGKTAPGLTAKFRLAPDTVPRESVAPPKELLRELKQTARLLKFYESLPDSWKREIARWIAAGKQEETRKRRAGQMAERLFETLEAERDLPPLLAMALRQNAKAWSRWQRMFPSQKRRRLLGIFHYRNPESRARRIARWVEEIGGKARSGARGTEDILD
jgi:uncharacterized protein YdeI (YjbR/CyaY-like superfamily)